MAREEGSCRQIARSQSAMEYLMTYGWAILIIAVVLGALYALGVFNAVNFAPKVPGGGCHVFRPNGPGTSWNVNLVGSCNSALPQYVAQFNGQSSYVNISNSQSLNDGIVGTNTLTVSFWEDHINVPSTYNNLPVFKGQQNTDGSPWEYSFAFYGNWFFISGVGVVEYTIQNGTLCNVIGVYNGSSLTVYVNGVLSGTASEAGVDIISSASPLTFGSSDQAAAVSSSGPSGGAGGGVINYFEGSIADVQIYNTSLSANQVAYLYNEGIGGVPISPQYLVGWWPLNGDTNDYSGNNNNGVPTNVTFNGTWTNGYNVP